MIATSTRFSLCLVALALTAQTADAGEAPPDARLAVVVRWIVDTRADLGAGGSRPLPLSECTDAVASARKQSIATVSDSHDGFAEFGATKDSDGYWVLSINDAEKRMCVAHERLLTLVKHYDTFFWAAEYTRTLNNSPTVAEGQHAIDKSAECFAAVTALATAKIPASEPYVVANTQRIVVAKTVGDLKAVCETYKKAGEAALGDIAARKAAYEARLKTAGITGDKAEWFKHYDGQLFLSGGRAPSDLKQYAAASVWYAYSYSSQPDIRGNYAFELRRYQFKGSKLTKQTNKTFQRPLSFKNSIGSVMK